MQCLTPIFLKNRDLYVPCGKCNICRSNYIKFWQSRLSQQMEFSDLSLFTTLTFDDDNYPVDFEDRRLHKDYLQKFFKRLRKCLNKPFKYFAVSEFGSKNDRLHFHILFFFDLQGKDVTSFILDFENFCRKSWKFGFIQNVKCNTMVITYMLKYELKDIDKSKTVRLISKGISKDFCDKVTQEDLYNYEKIGSLNYSFRPNRYIINRVFPHGKDKSDDCNSAFEDFKFEKRSHGCIQPFKVYDSLCRKYMRNVVYDSVLQEFVVSKYDRSDWFVSRAYYNSDLEKYIVPFNIVVSYFNKHVCLTKKSKL